MGVTEKAVLYSRSRFSWEPSEIGAAKPDGARLLREAQPPLGGCVLKRLQALHRGISPDTAAFRRLCVETTRNQVKNCALPTAAFRRLCVETSSILMSEVRHVAQPPLGGCVLKRPHPTSTSHNGPAAFRRLCVETSSTGRLYVVSWQPPLGGCVLKRSHAKLSAAQYLQPPLGGCVLKRYFRPS